MRYSPRGGGKDQIHRKRAGISATLFLGVVVLPMVLSSCASWRWGPALPLKTATTEQLTELLRERETELDSMKGLFRVSVQGPGIPITQSLEGAMYYRRPDSLRLRGFNRIGGELFDLVLREDLYTLRLPTLGQTVVGRLGQWERMGKMGRSVKLSLWAMQGAIGIAAVSKDERAVLDEDEDQYRLDVYAAGKTDQASSKRPTRQIWFEREHLQVVRVDRLSPLGEVEASMEFEDFRPVGEGQPKATAMGPAVLVKPFTITTYDRKDESSLRVEFHEIVPNPALKQEELGTARARGEEHVVLTGGLMKMLGEGPREDPRR